MKLGIDYNLFLKYPEKMIQISQDTIKNKGRIFIIAEKNLKETRSGLIDLMSLFLISKPFWNNIYCIPDWIVQKKIPSYKNKLGEVVALRKEDWYSVKGKISEEINLDMYIDSNEWYAKYFSPGVFCYMK